MAITAAGHGFGAKIELGGNEIAELSSIGGIKITTALEDVSSHQSDAAFEEIVAGMLKAGPVAIEGNFIPGDTNGQVALLALQVSRALGDFVITLPTAAFGTTFTFKAIVGDTDVGAAPINGKVPFSSSLAITGQPVVAISASVNITALTCTDDVGGAADYPAFAAATYEYVFELANAAVEYSVNATFAAGVCTLTDATGGTHTLLTTVESSEMTSPGAGLTHNITISVKETGKVATVYTLHIIQS